VAGSLIWPQLPASWPPSRAQIRPTAPSIGATAYTSAVGADGLLDQGVLLSSFAFLEATFWTQAATGSTRIRVRHDSLEDSAELDGRSSQSWTQHGFDCGTPLRRMGRHASNPPHPAACHPPWRTFLPVAARSPTRPIGPNIAWAGVFYGIPLCCGVGPGLGTAPDDSVDQTAEFRALHKATEANRSAPCSRTYPFGDYGQKRSLGARWRPSSSGRDSASPNS